MPSATPRGKRTTVRPLLVLLALAPLAAADGEPSAIESRRVKAVARGLAYLARQQMRDGSFGRNVSVGITSLSLLAFMASGHQEHRGPYGAHLRKGVDFLLKRSLPARTRGKPAGYIWMQGDADSRMHGHGYATQVLVLSYGANRAAGERARKIRATIRRAVRVIENSQTVTGGWGYEPSGTSFHEGSVTVTVVQALRLARDAGFVIDRQVHERGLRYLRESQRADGSFRYSLLEPRTSPALTAAAITAMHGFGQYYGPSIQRGLEYLEQRYQDRGGMTWPFYADYYAAQAFHRAGGPHQKLFNTTVLPRILARQRDSAWDDKDFAHAPGAQGRTYATAMSCLALSVQDGYLPLFQR